MRHKKFQSAIDGWWAHWFIAVAQTVEQVIGLHRFVAVPYQFEYTPAHGGKACTALAAQCVSTIERATDATAMRMMRAMERFHRPAFAQIYRLCHLPQCSPNMPALAVEINLLN
jgi:hypothetical protein